MDSDAPALTDAMASHGGAAAPAGAVASTAAQEDRVRAVPRWLVPVAAVAWLGWTVVRLVTGLGPSGGLGSLPGTTGAGDLGTGWGPFSAPDAPNGPGGPSTTAGGAGAGGGPQGGGGGGDGGRGGNGGDGGDDDYGPPPGHDDWLDFADWASWTTVKNLLPGGLSMPIDILEAGPDVGNTLMEVGERRSKQQDALDLARDPDAPGAGEGL